MQNVSFGAPYAILNISKLGFRYFRIGFKLTEHSLERLTEKFKTYPNVGWIFASKGWCNLAIGIFARDNAEINDISASIRQLLTTDDELVFQSELTSLYSFGNRPIDPVGMARTEPMPIIDAIYQPLSLSPLELDYIKLLTMNAAVPETEMAEILNITQDELRSLDKNLCDQGVIVGYQERIDYGDRHWKVFIDSSSKFTNTATEDLLGTLWHDNSCLYVERANAKYDLEFELITDQIEDVQKYCKDFGRSQIIQLTRNLYTNLYPLSKAANLGEIQKSLANQDGDVIDLRNSKLWYLNYQGAQSYLDITVNKKYFETMAASELNLFDQIIDFVHKNYAGFKFHVIDIGSGNGLKGRLFIEKLGESNVKAYYPVDIQPVELAAALQSHQESTYAKHPTLLDFENLNARFPLKLLPGEVQIVLFLGGTYGNFPSQTINQYLKPLISSSTLLFVGMPLRAPGRSDQDIIDSYSTLNVEEVAFGPLIQIGFEKKDFEHNPDYPNLYVMPRLDCGRLVSTLKLKNDVYVCNRVFKKGTLFQLTTSWKPVLSEVLSAFEQDFSVTLTHHNKDMAISLLDKMK